MIVSMNVSHFVEICKVLTILHQLICRGVTNFGTRCIRTCRVEETSVLHPEKNFVFSAQIIRTTGGGKSGL